MNYTLPSKQVENNLGYQVLRILALDGMTVREASDCLIKIAAILIKGRDDVFLSKPLSGMEVKISGDGDNKS